MQYKSGLPIPNGLISPKCQQLIYEEFGKPVVLI
jgi:hypothetical protein